MHAAVPGGGLSVSQVVFLHTDHGWPSSVRTWVGVCASLPAGEPADRAIAAREEGRTGAGTCVRKGRRMISEDAEMEEITNERERIYRL